MKKELVAISPNFGRDTMACRQLKDLIYTVWSEKILCLIKKTICIKRRSVGQDQAITVRKDGLGSEQKQ